jgi:hypothetical protein
MIVDKSVLAAVSNKWDKPFRAAWSNLVGDWCVSFFNEYNEAPKKAIEPLFDSWREGADKDTIKLVENFLSSLSNEYELLAKESNSAYTTDLASKYFNRVRLEKLNSSVEGLLSKGNVEDAINNIYAFNKVELAGNGTINVLQDVEVIKNAFEETHNALIEYPGDLGKFFKEYLERDGFIAFMGPEKRGKSFWLLDVVYRGLSQRRRVAYFEAGDMSLNQVTRRLMTRIAHHPKTPGRVKYPVKITRNPSDPIASIEYESKKFERPLSWRLAVKACEKFTRRLKSKESYLKLSVHPNSSLSVRGIEAVLDQWKRDEDWIPDIIVIDYADILAGFPGVKEYREQINENWKALRGMSQSRHCLVVTATQSDAASYTMETINRSNFTDDKRKLAHVTGIVGLNQTDEEKAEGIMRLNWVVLREGEFSESRCVHVASCLALANPAVRSTF